MLNHSTLQFYGKRSISLEVWWGAVNCVRVENWVHCVSKMYIFRFYGQLTGPKHCLCHFPCISFGFEFPHTIPVKKKHCISYDYILCLGDNAQDRIFNSLVMSLDNMLIIKHLRVQFSNKLGKLYRLIYLA